jgi:RHS repeat-associated protein
VGNRTRVTKGTEVKDYTYDAANQIASGPEGRYEHDPYGNLVTVRNGEGQEIKSYTYDGLARLASYTDSEGTVGFSYDPLSRLEQREKDSTTLSFRYDGSSAEPLQEMTEGTLSRTYTLAPSGTPLAQDTQGTLAFLGLNQHSDIAFSLDAQGSLSGSKTYNPFGEELFSDLSASLGFQHDYSDPDSGLSWMQARWYSPELGTFTSPDPKAGGLALPLSQNLYPYCMGNPINLADPSGQSAMDQDIELQIEGAEESLHYHEVMLQVRRTQLQQYEAWAKKNNWPIGSEGEYEWRKQRVWNEEKAIASLRARLAELYALRPIAAELGFSQGTLDHLRKMGWSEQEIMQLWKDMVDKLKQSSPAEINEALIKIGEENSLLPFSEEDIRNMISKVTDNAELEEAYLSHYTGGKKGEFREGTFWSEVTKAETWEKAAPGILTGVTITLSVVACVGTFGGYTPIVGGCLGSLTAPVLAQGSLMGAVVIGGTQVAVEEIDAIVAYANGDISGNELVGVSLINVTRGGIIALSPIMPTPAGAIVVPIAMECVDSEKTLDVMR